MIAHYFGKFLTTSADTHLLVAKFANHLPLYRQAVIYAREGVDLDRALLASWLDVASAVMRPLADPDAGVRPWQNQKSAPVDLRAL